jgi:hypothetical protein
MMPAIIITIYDISMPRYSTVIIYMWRVTVVQRYGVQVPCRVGLYSACDNRNNMIRRYGIQLQLRVLCNSSYQFIAGMINVINRYGVQLATVILRYACPLLKAYRISVRRLKVAQDTTCTNV